MATEGYLATTQRYDVFLSHTSGDKDAVERLARRLRAEAQLEPFLDKWHLIPGNPWQEELEQALNQSRTCAVFLGPADLGPWENEEMRLALDKRTRNPAFRVIPVLLPNTQMPEKGPLPDFLRRVTWVDFRSGLEDADAFHRLVSGIKGIAPGPAVPTPDKPSLPPDADICPYLGLETFQEKDAEFFFGRAALTQWLGERLRERRFLAVIGPSLRQWQIFGGTRRSAPGTATGCVTGERPLAGRDHDADRTTAGGTGCSIGTADRASQPGTAYAPATG